MTPEDEKIETCRVAMKAAIEAINDYCGTTPRTISIGGVQFQLPDEIHEIVTAEMAPQEKIDRIARHDWTQREADKMCSQLIRAKDQGKCRHHMTQAIATAIVTGEELSD